MILLLYCIIVGLVKPETLRGTATTLAFPGRVSCAPGSQHFSGVTFADDNIIRGDWFKITAGSVHNAHENKNKI